MMRPLCLWTVAMLAASATAFIPHTAFRPSSPVATRRCSRAVSRGTGVSMMSGRRPFIAGNWKENPDTLEAAIDLAKAVSTASSSASNVDVAVVVPFPFLVPVKETLKGSNVLIGAQDLPWGPSGSFAGTRSAGHSSATRTKPSMPSSRRCWLRA
ncbi:triosephosphate isomerase [Nannochloropsis gaditana]|uniref:Triosephosphate isomerase n=1 Tax=Nannochloropsis gaditana TaxID=72520 RepID=W7T671_9STRA|nr:triosephosphate isomerase [Nannochloropsis gaditana]